MFHKKSPCPEIEGGHLFIMLSVFVLTGFEIGTAGRAGVSKNLRDHRTLRPVKRDRHP